MFSGISGPLVSEYVVPILTSSTELILFCSRLFLTVVIPPVFRGLDEYWNLSMCLTSRLISLERIKFVGFCYNLLISSYWVSIESFEMDFSCFDLG